MPRYDVPRNQSTVRALHFVVAWECKTMIRSGVGLAASVLAISMMAATMGDAFAAPPDKKAAPAAAPARAAPAPAARAAPPPRPAPAAIARPAPVARPAPAMARPAAPHMAPRIATPARPAPRIAAPAVRSAPAIQRAAPAP